MEMDPNPSLQSIVEKKWVKSGIEYVTKEKYVD